MTPEWTVSWSPVFSLDLHPAERRSSSAGTPQPDLESLSRDYSGPCDPFPTSAPLLLRSRWSKNPDVELCPQGPAGAIALCGSGALRC